MVGKLAVCTAWGSPFCWTHNAYNLMNLRRPDGVQVKFFPGFGWCPARRHMDGVERAMEWGATHICFLGGDQLHPTDILIKFYKHIKSGWSAVSAMVPCRGWIKTDLTPKPFMKIAYKLKPEYQKEPPATPKTEYLDLVKREDGDYQEIHVIGTGALMFNAKLLLSLEKPWFFETILDRRRFERAYTMDSTFSWRLVREAGARILCDLTIDIAHMDIFPITEDYGDRFEDWPVWKS